MPSSAIARKMITFSLVSIPVSVYAATSRHQVPLHMVHVKDGARIRQKKVCSAEEVEVPDGDIVRGYELPSGDTLILTREDLESLPTPDTREIRVLGFLPEERVDVLHYDKAYYLGADQAAARPYALLREALTQSGQVAIARTALRTRDNLVVLRVRDDVISMVTLLWPDEVRPTEGIAPATPELRPEEVALARQLMDTISSDFDPSLERDEYTVALKEVVEAKLAGLPAPHLPEARVLPPAGGVPDLMAVLEAAVKRAEQEHPKTGSARGRKTTARKAPARKPRGS
ncbi:DNA end-binding protein Ku [Kitasatospora atroaurantiaca]|uniref:Non-homologous end joining protein Ku n=2 Tax=Kitasatospora atroaurantiaca TaxID=285545 RepID=A0A561EN86_9ACTN|nr:DNA end-binding protein Ku [Kitasatospora atroaurantiaca]